MYFIFGITLGIVIGILAKRYTADIKKSCPPGSDLPPGRFSPSQDERRLRAEGYRNIINYLCRHGGDE